MNSVAWLCRNPTTQISLCLTSRLQSSFESRRDSTTVLRQSLVSRLRLLLVERIEYAILPVRREAMIRQVVPVLLIAIAVTATATHVEAQKSDSSKNGPAGGETIEIADAQVSLIQNTFVAAPIAGVAAEVLVSEGDQVDKGCRLIQLDSEQAETELEAARAAYEAAGLESGNDVDARYAKRTLEVRQQELTQSIDANRQFSGSVSDAEIAKQELVVDQARLAIEQADHDLQVAKARAREKFASTRIVETLLKKHGVEAPVSGLVVEVAVEPGEWVEPGKPIVRIVSLNPIRVECFVEGAIHGAELVGRAIEFFPTASSRQAADEPTQPLVGQVTFVSPELHPVTGQARLWATIENPQLRARAGMRGRLVILAPPIVTDPAE